ncbi:MAG: tetratricopeptide repeat protein, partial [Planctomycetaceae bacterium]|nr:tetratricopeptide repeat protein [Planctomycetaceae bacterium]
MKPLVVSSFRLIVIWCSLASGAFGQSTRDKVTLLDEKTGSRTRVPCTVIDHTGEFIRYRVREDGPVTVKRSSEVISIETPQVQSHIEALENYASGQTKQAVSLFEQALKEEYRDWVRRDILAMLVKCALRQNNYAQAGNRFLILYQSDPTTQYFKSIPLLWRT